MTTGPEPRHGDARRIAGLAIRTTNAAEANPQTAKIPGVWERFMSEPWVKEMLDQIGAFGPLMAVYSAYESDASGRYQLLVGRQVRSTASVPDPLQTVSIADGSYLVFQNAGALPQVVIDGWRAVWAYFSRPNVAPRAYTFDFEIYADGGSVEIWVAVKD